MSASAALLLVHVGATLAMVGLIWFVQLVHYPLFAHVGQAQFTAYENRHQQRTTWIVAPLMLTELVTATALVIWRPASVNLNLAWIGLGMVTLLWLSTALVQVPCHQKLSQRFDAQTHRRLVRSNWWRTALWSIRGALALWFMTGIMQ